MIKTKIESAPNYKLRIAIFVFFILILCNYCLFYFLFFLILFVDWKTMAAVEK